MKTELIENLNKLIAFDSAQLAGYENAKPVEKDKVKIIKKHLTQYKALLDKLEKNILSTERTAEIFVAISEELSICRTIAKNNQLVGKEKLT